MIIITTELHTAFYLYVRFGLVLIQGVLIQAVLELTTWTKLASNSW